jgi:hypothetical protein
MHRSGYDAYAECAATMKSRVTITLDPDVHARAKQAARARQTTVSGLIEAYLRSPAAAPARSGPSLVDEMLGSSALRSVPAGVDRRFDALHARQIAPRRADVRPARPVRAVRGCHPR